MLYITRYFIFQFFVAYGNCKAQFRDAVEMGLMQVDVIKRFTEAHSGDLTFARTAKGKMNGAKPICKRD